MATAIYVYPVLADGPYALISTLYSRVERVFTPIEEASAAIAETSHRIERIPDPVERAFNAIEKAPNTIDGISWPVVGVSGTIERLPLPAEEVPVWIESVFNLRGLTPASQKRTINGIYIL